MLSYARDIAPLRVLAVRGLLFYPLLRALLLSIAAMAEMFAGPGAANGLDNPLGVVVLAMALGAVDTRRRGETVLWANLGYPALTAPSIFGIAAFLGELIVAVVRS